MKLYSLIIAGICLISFGCNMIGDVGSPIDDDRITGEWLNPPEMAHLDEPWERLTFDDDDLYARFTFDNFRAEWMLVADSLRYELAGKELRLQDRDGSMQTHQMVALTDSTLTFQVGDIVERWRRPQASDPGY